jgi:hypothetical protein
MTERKLDTLEGRRRSMLCALASAPPDDEPSGIDEDAVAAKAVADYRSGDGISPKQLRAELGLD